MSENNSNKKFEDALQLLNEAAKEKKQDIQNILGDKYNHIVDAIQETVAEKKGEFGRWKKTAKRVIDDHGDQVQEMAADLDEKVHENPWSYIGGVALGSLLLGYILGSSKR